MKWYLNSKISTKLIIGFFIVSLIVCGIGIYSVIALNHVNESYGHLLDTYDHHEKDQIDILQNEIEENIQVNKLILEIAIVFTLFFSVLLGRFIASLISNPLRKLAQESEKFARGDMNLNLNLHYKDEVGLVIEAFMKTLENIKKLINEFEFLTSASVNGSLRERAHIDRFEGAYKQLIEGTNNIMDILVGHIDAVPTEIILMDPEFNIKFVNNAVINSTSLSSDDLIGTKCYNGLESDICNNDKCPAKKSLKEGVESFGETLLDDGTYFHIKTAPMKDLKGNIVGLVEVVSDLTGMKAAQHESEKHAKAVEQQMMIAKKQAEYQKNEVGKLIKALDKLSKGELDIETYVENADEDTKEVRENFKIINNSLEASVNIIKSYIQELSQVLSNLANKDFLSGIERDYLGDFATLKDSINFIIEQLSHVLAEINDSAAEVESGADQVAATSQQLSQGASEQASAVEEIGATINQISEQTKRNSENANRANELSVKAKEDAQRGNDRMIIMLEAMNEIRESSKNIGNVIKVIDEIAFQTNILALNAAVEAARAGEHGKGFAVVSQEVRNLAVRSANAAKETTDMIENSIQKIEEGYKIANDTAEALTKIVNGVSDAVTIVGTIAEASVQQTKAIQQIDQGIEQISAVTHINMATSEESASASEQMAGQAEVLKELIQQFKIRRENEDKSSTDNRMKEDRGNMVISLDKELC